VFVDQPRRPKRHQVSCQLAGFAEMALLDIPLVYRLSQLPFSTGFQDAIEPYFPLGEERRVLDVGCGPRLSSPFPQGHLVGIDISEAYAADYRQQRLVGEGGVQSSVSAAAASATCLPFADCVFDECRSVGLLHHLTDEQVVKAVKEMGRVLAPGGKWLLVDGVLPSSRLANPIASAVRRADRGKWMRPESELKSLVTVGCDRIVSWTRFSYSLCRLEGIIATGVKSRNVSKPCPEHQFAAQAAACVR
jgi:SAM-dependent methyltransferase